MVIARDDLETLKKVGDALQQLAASKAPTRPGNKWKDFRSGIADALEGKADVREMQAAARMSPSVLEPEGDVGTSSGVMGLGRGFLASLPKEVRKDVAAAMSRAALSNADEWRSWAEWVRPDPYVLPKKGTFSQTPICAAKVNMLKGEDLAIIPILRAGLEFTKPAAKPSNNWPPTSRPTP